MTVIDERTDENGDLVQSGRCRCGRDAERTLTLGVSPRFDRALLEALRYEPLRCGSCTEAERRQAAEEDERRIAEQRRRERVRRVGIPAAYRSVDADDCAPRALASAERWAAEDCPGGVCLTGRIGVGKTHLAAWAARRRAEAGHEVLWFSAPSLFATLRGSYGPSPAEAALRQITGRDGRWRLGRPRDLVIDDLDKTRPTEFIAEQIYVAIDSCVAERRALFLTTNCTLAQIAGGEWIDRRYGEPIASRIDGYCAVHKIGGRDRRAGGAA